MLIGLALILGLSPFLRGYYDLAQWGPAGLVLLAAVLAAAVAGPRIPAISWIAVGSLVALSLWSLLSGTWGESWEGALLASSRWLLYAAGLMVVLVLLRSRGAAEALVWALAAGLAVLLAWLTFKLLGNDASKSFIGRRLSEPLEYTNGLGGYLIAGFWALIALAERRRPLVLSALAIGAATLDLALLVLTQSRGVALALAVSAVVVLAVVPGRLRRGWVLVACVAGVAAAWRPLLDVYGSSTDAPLAESVVHSAVGSALVSAVAVAVVWALVLLVEWAMDVSEAPRRAAGQVATFGMIAILVVGAAGAAIAAPRLVDRGREQYRAFVNLQTAASGSRLASGAGNRYDYWRVAVKDFRERPVAGIGAGSYPVGYFRERQTAEDIRQPHSIELETLAELGLVGGILLGAFIVAVAVGLVLSARRAATDLRLRSLVVACAGIFAGWLVHTSGDWLHLLPGLTGIALCAAAVLLCAGGADTPRPRSRFVAIGTLAGCLLIVAFGAIMLSRLVVADHYRAAAQSRIASDPPEAIRSANRSLAYNAEALPPYYAKAAAYARLDRYRDALTTLRAAARREPDNFITWTLIGDLASRGGDVRRAGAAYRRAAQLNPLDPTLMRLVQAQSQGGAGG